jgi:hypothetical protein
MSITGRYCTRRIPFSARERSIRLRHAVPKRRACARRVRAGAVAIPVPVCARARALGHETLRGELAAVAALGQVEVIPERKEVEPALMSVAARTLRKQKAHV